MSTRYAAALAGAPPRLRDALRASKALAAGVVARLVAPGETAAAAVDDMFRLAHGDDATATDDELAAFLDLRDIAQQEAARLRREPGLAPPWREALDADKRRRLRDNDDLERAFRRPVLGRAAALAPVGAGAVAPPPVSRTHRTSHARARSIGHDQTRLEREEQLRRRLIDELVDELVHIGAPSAHEAGRSADPRATMSLLAAGRRASTLRARLRAWKTFRQWLTLAHGEYWPSSWLSILDYCRCRAAEPCGRSTLLNVIGSVAFMERVGGFGGASSHTSNTLFREACRELCVGLTARAGGQPGHQAPTILTSCLMRLETMVTDVTQLQWHRAYAWWKLVQTWAALRFDDHGGLSPSNAKLTQEGLVFDLTRTKTTGCGKRIERRPSGVSNKAYFVIADWLEQGWNLWNILAPQQRDYFLVSPRPDLQETVARELKYGEAAGWSRALLRLLMIDLAEHSVVDAAAAAFTEHSGRSYLVSAALSLGADDSHLLPVGGWSASPARSYMRTARQRLLQVQQQVAQLGRERLGGPDEFGEGETLRSLRDRLVAGGHDEGEVTRLCNGLCAFPNASCGTQLWRTASREPEDIVDDGAGPRDDAAPGAHGGKSAAGAGPQADPSAGSSTDSARRSRENSTAEDNPRLPSDAKGYVVSISKKTGYRRLHALGRCYRVPGVDYGQFELLGEDAPPERLYDGYCAQCWKSGPSLTLKPAAELAGEALADASPASADDSSSTSSED